MIHVTSINDNIALDGPTSGGKTAGFDRRGEVVSGAEGDDSGDVLGCSGQGDHPGSEGSGMVEDGDAVGERRLCPQEDLT